MVSLTWQSLAANCSFRKQNKLPPVLFVSTAASSCGCTSHPIHVNRNCPLAPQGPSPSMESGTAGDLPDPASLEGVGEWGGVGGALYRTHRLHSLTVRTYCSSRSKHLTYHFCSNRTNPNSRKKLLQHSAWEVSPLLPALTRLCFQPWRAPVAAKREVALFQPFPVSSFVPTRQEDLGEAGGDRLTVLTQSCCPFRTHHIFTPQALPSAPSLHPRDLPRPSLPRVSQLAKR